MIDWENPAAIDFLLVTQFSVTGALYTCRPDSIQSPSSTACRWWSSSWRIPVCWRAAFNENLPHYKQEIPTLFWFNALLIENQERYVMDYEVAAIARALKVPVAWLYGQSN